jgi:hypothetical protein
MPGEATPTQMTGIDKALIVALATPFAYVLAFQFDRGYLEYFGVPYILAEVSMRSLLWAAAAVVGGFWSLYNIANVIAIFWPSSQPKIVQVLLAGFLAVAALLALAFFLLGAPLRAWLIAACLVALSGSPFVIIPLLSHKHLNTYAEKLQATVAGDTFVDKTLPGRLVQRGATMPLLLTICAFFIGYDFASAIGIYVARTQDTFLVSATDEGDPCVVIRLRDSGLLCAVFDPATSRIQGEYQFLKADKVKVALRRTGRLLSPEDLLNRLGR